MNILTINSAGDLVLEFGASRIRLNKITGTNTFIRVASHFVNRHAKAYLEGVLTYEFALLNNGLYIKHVF